jgi:hypothetical protein
LSPVRSIAGLYEGRLRVLHLSDLIIELGVDSRFQPGAEAVRRGRLKPGGRQRGRMKE